MMRWGDHRMRGNILAVDPYVFLSSSAQEQIAFEPVETTQSVREQQRITRDARRISHEPRIQSNDRPARMLSGLHCFSARASFAAVGPWVADPCILAHRYGRPWTG